MSLINAHNIDEWLFDHLEGNLDPSQTTMLQDFLAQNPEYSADLSAWKAAFVTTGPSIPAYAGAEHLLQGGGAAAAAGASSSAALAGGGAAASLGGLAAWVVGFLLILGCGLIAWWQLTKGNLPAETPQVRVEVPAPTKALTPAPAFIEAVSAAPPPVDSASAHSTSVPQVHEQAVKARTPEVTPKPAQAFPPPQPSPDLEPVPATPVDTIPQTAPPPIADLPLIPPPEKAVLPQDTSPTLPAKEGPNKKPRGKKKKKKKVRKPVKKVRMVPLQSDVF